ncbi:protein kinase [Sorangium sp. So ce185]|uniref:protein kinase domain-containing protein n=1 Tax=Sorangium sp. So ce185 TaxID=3133287 RepID=UPI003F636D8A
MPESDLPPIIASRYRVLDEIGQGGIGRVLRVEHVHTGEHLALKVLLACRGADATTLERFKREARIPALIRSEHVVRVTDADVAPELGGAPFFVMELLDGMDVEAYVASKGALPHAEAIEILTQVARALDKAMAGDRLAQRRLAVGRDADPGLRGGRPPRGRPGVARASAGVRR